MELRQDTGCAVLLLGFQRLSWGLPALTRKVTAPPACLDSSSPPGLCLSIPTGLLGPVLLPEPLPPNKGSLFHCLFARCQTHSSKSLLPGLLISGSGPVCGLSSASLPPAPLSPAPLLSITLSPSRATQAVSGGVLGQTFPHKLGVNFELPLKTFWRISYVSNCLNYKAVSAHV